MGSKTRERENVQSTNVLYKSILMRKFSRWSKWDLQMTADLRLGLKWDFCCRDRGSRMVEFLHWRNRWSCDWRIEGALGDPAVFTLPRLAIASRFFSAQKPAQLFYHLSYHLSSHHKLHELSCHHLVFRRIVQERIGQPIKVQDLWK